MTGRLKGPTVLFLVLAIIVTRQNYGTISALSTTATKNSAPTIVNHKSVPGLKNGMDYTKLGSSDLIVSKVCMGTMTFGEEGVAQLNMAWDQYGINFLDTAEMYPVPTTAATQGKTDETVAAFLKGRRREDVILATKIAGRSGHIDWLRKEKSFTKVNRKQILESIDSSLERLGTDYVDLFQIHWPDRYTGGLFGQPDFSPSSVHDSVDFEEQLSALKEVVDSGKARCVGVSNETPYGVCALAELAKRDPKQFARIISIQNSYSLVCRKDFEAGLAEACYYHDVALLPYSPLAGGILTAKYTDSKNIPVNSRLLRYPGFMERYLGSQCDSAVREYRAIAEEQGISSCELALAWCFQREHVCSTIVGATSTEQLKECIGSYDIKLNDDAMEKISRVYKKYTDPTKAY